MQQKIRYNATLGFGLEWKWNIGLTASFDMYNPLNTKYEIGGQLLKGVPGLGRNWVARLTYDF